MNKMQWWMVWFVDEELDMTVKCELKATSFDDALNKARTIDPRFGIGCVMGWRE